MTTTVITPSAEMAVTLADAKVALRLDHDALDTLVEAYVRGITSFSEHICQRAFVNQVRKCTLDRFPAAIQLTGAPLVSVASVSYYDADNVQQTLDPADYTVDAVSEPGYVVPAPLTAWPATYARVNAVEVIYTCGYGADASAVPAEAKLYVTAKLVEQFDPAVRLEKDTVQGSFLDRLLDPLKVYG